MNTGFRDEVEQKLATVADAQAFCLKYHPAFLRWLEKESRWADSHCSRPQHAEASLQLIQLGFARMALRNGSQSAEPLFYHNENHILEILHRLHRVVEQQAGAVQDWYTLALFAAAHDLRQREPQESTQHQGCGANEQASWLELERMVKEQRLSLPEAVMQTLRWMIEGSTFYMGMRLGSCQGAWAADLVRRQAMAAATREQVLLAADLDTANVAEGFLELTQSSLALARERLLLKPAASAQAALDFMRKFLEEVQWHYMAECQQFHSRAARTVFTEAKARNLRHLRAFIDRLKSHEPFADIQALTHWYLKEAREEAERMAAGSNQA